MPVKPEIKILDLGTGSGYLSFAIAKKYPKVTVIGLDIVEKALEVNRIKAEDLAASGVGLQRILTGGNC